MEDIHLVGGTPALLKYLMAQGFIDGSCLTVTGEQRVDNGYRGVLRGVLRRVLQALTADLSATSKASAQPLVVHHLTCCP